MVIETKLGNNSYNIILERGILNDAATELNLERKVLIVSDEGVPEKYPSTISNYCSEPYTIRVKQGEGSKSIETWKELLSFMLEKGFTRTDCVVAVGGGVVGDLAGFCAASYMRGIDFYNIPTTLLSQVDSSVGGKTAVNLDGIKNIVGAFYQPKKVLIDPDVLSTLDKRQFSNGLAEAIKTAVCFDEKMFDMFENCNINDNIEKIIEMSIKIKSGVVESDEKESGLRRALNFGHTIGHGIEAQGGLYHGECVALGMLAMCSPQVRTRLEKVLKKAGLPIKYEYDKAKILEAVSHDKKMAGETLNTVYVDKVGSYQFRTVTFEEFKNIFKENF